MRRRTKQACATAQPAWGGSNHLACLLLNSAIGIDVTHIPDRSGAQAMQDTLAGRIDYQCPSAPVALPQIEAKAVRALAILSRSPLAQHAGPAVRTRAGAGEL